MRVLMLGWEYPPHIAGGLGVACEGLTKALARVGLDITFVVPCLMGGESAPHMTLRDPSGVMSKSKRKQRIKKVKIPSALTPYVDDKSFDDLLAAFKYDPDKTSSLLRSSLFPRLNRAEFEKFLASISLTKRAEKLLGAGYGSNVFEQVALYTEKVLELVAEEEFDVIHAHDWMTYPAGVAISKFTGAPLVVHVHSLEYDRSGKTVNTRIHAIEALGIHTASAVCAVSYYTRSIVHQQHHIPLNKVFAVHNGILSKKIKHYPKRMEKWPGKVVLFLGRVTYQKGPDCFVRAAAKVVPYVSDVLFVMAGTGDQLPRMKKLANELGISQNFYFPGFVKGKDLEEALSVADLYIMPSVSEPFGLSALEAVDFDTPALISKQSGAAEVLNHALKFDFWDVDRLADLMINGLIHEEMRTDIIWGAKEELKKLRWDAAAAKVYKIYNLVAVKN
ncbi:MAG: glycosyltransferase family 4 protein [Deltaproteobacteria bacterium]|nr:glycosyltransferase family 4 protein [Deltaproteobacteria bacterium]